MVFLLAFSCIAGHGLNTCREYTSLLQKGLKREREREREISGTFDSVTRAIPSYRKSTFFYFFVF